MNIFNKNSILLAGSIIVALFAYNWYDIEQKNGNLSFEPIVTLAAAILTVVGYLFSKENNLEKGGNYKTHQSHFVLGDNIYGNKYTLNFGKTILPILSIIFCLVIIFYYTNFENYQSPKISDVNGDVNINYINADDKINLDQGYDPVLYNKLKNIKINYNIEINGKAEKLIATVEGKSYVLKEGESIGLNIIDCKDFDGNGSLDALVSINPGGGVGYFGDTYYFQSYIGDGHFQESDNFGYSFGKPIVKLRDKKWSVVVTSNNEGVNTDEPQEVTEHYILKLGQAVKIEESHHKPLDAIVEINVNSGEDFKEVTYDLDYDGELDTIKGHLFFRFGRYQWGVYFGNGKKLVNNETIYKRIGVLESKTNGIHDLVADFDEVLKWNGITYE
jgi:hypothetical protein